MTSNDKTGKALRAFFDDELMPLAARMKQDGVQFLDVKIDKGVDSYYINRKKRSMTRADFEWGGAELVETFANQIKEFWRGQGQDRLVTLVPTLEKLAVALQTNDEQDSEVSPFIYVMY